MYEHHSARPVSRRRFVQRLVVHLSVAMVVVAGSLAMGMCGYRYFEGLPWLDAFLNSAMLLGGMGPVDELHTPGGKFFAGLYSLYCGLVFLVTAGLLLTPVVHRILHTFHWSER